MSKPMATYLATIDIGNWKFRNGKTPGGIRETMAVDPALAGTVNLAFAIDDNQGTSPVTRGL